MKTPPLSLYVHFPWCRRKCPFCDLDARGLGNTLPVQAYVQAVTADMRYAAETVQGRAVHSIFFGGGTPGLLPVAELECLLQAAADNFLLTPTVEISLELHPMDCTAPRLAGYRAAGINRISIGVQSFDDHALTAIGRPYDGAYARTAVSSARRYFERLNLDLMYGLPGQCAQTAINDLGTALALGPGHLSWYPLSLQPGTPFYRRPPPALPQEDTLATIETRGYAELATHGYGRYEICAWALPGNACRHNLNYWHFGDYLGLGPGAHGKLSNASNLIVRERRLRVPHYLAAAGGPQAVAERRTLSTADRTLEFMMNALRLTGGFSQHLYTERTGLQVSSILHSLGHAADAGLLSLRQGWATPTARGLELHNDLVAMFDSPHSAIHPEAASA